VEGFEVVEFVGRGAVVAVFGMEDREVDRLVATLLEFVYARIASEACKCDDKLMAGEDTASNGVGVEVASEFAGLVSLKVAAIARIAEGLESCKFDKLVTLEKNTDSVSVGCEVCSGGDVIILAVSFDTIDVILEDCEVGEFARRGGLIKNSAVGTSLVGELVI
jgi:hypothetical protein